MIFRLFTHQKKQKKLHLRCDFVIGWLRIKCKISTNLNPLNQIGVKSIIYFIVFFFYVTLVNEFLSIGFYDYFLNILLNVLSVSQPRTIFSSPSPLMACRRPRRASSCCVFRHTRARRCWPSVCATPYTTAPPSTWTTTC